LTPNARTFAIVQCAIASLRRAHANPMLVRTLAAVRSRGVFDMLCAPKARSMVSGWRARAVKHPRNPLDVASRASPGRLCRAFLFPNKTPHCVLPGGRMDGTLEASASRPWGARLVAHAATAPVRAACPPVRVPAYARTSSLIADGCLVMPFGAALRHLDFSHGTPPPANRRARGCPFTRHDRRSLLEV
jgi:hypothetical protein